MGVRGSSAQAFIPSNAAVSCRGATPLKHAPNEHQAGRNFKLTHYPFGTWLDTPVRRCRAPGPSRPGHVPVKKARKLYESPNGDRWYLIRDHKEYSE